ncbi:hypothetical protein BKA56DRAFT_582636 [Ilyonectria sp. MPI-CAGE-AT-0026]|nr:hypothetical protein BKA56DRAFT_582636 [Ilyonectria sp. MPI-CAGE-AT-0026]
MRKVAPIYAAITHNTHAARRTPTHNAAAQRIDVHRSAARCNSTLHTHPPSPLVHPSHITLARGQKQHQTCVCDLPSAALHRTLLHAQCTLQLHLPSYPVAAATQQVQHARMFVPIHLRWRYAFGCQVVVGGCSCVGMRVQALERALVWTLMLRLVNLMLSQHLTAMTLCRRIPSLVHVVLPFPVPPAARYLRHPPCPVHAPPPQVL